jgi:hypothetical protein
MNRSSLVWLESKLSMLPKKSPPKSRREHALDPHEKKASKQAIKKRNGRKARK